MAQILFPLFDEVIVVPSRTRAPHPSKIFSPPPRQLERRPSPRNQ